MALIKKSEFKNMDVKGMEDKMRELRMELIKVNAQIAVGTTPEKPGRVKQIKRTIARLNTHIRNKTVANISKISAKNISVKTKDNKNLGGKVKA